MMNNQSDSRIRFRSEALIALALAAAPVVALGFSRFAYGLFLPAMRSDLHWNLAAAGGQNTANALGYIVGCLAASRWARRFGSRRTFLAAMAVSTLMLLLSASSGSYIALAAFRTVGGLSTAVTFVVGSAIASRIHAGNQHHRSAFLVSIYMAGVGIGIVIAGIAVPAVLSGLSAGSGWRVGWVIMSILAVGALAAAAWGSRQVPEQKSAPDGESEPVRLRVMRPTFAWYLLFGAGYVSYMTFVVALLKSHGVGRAGEATFFIVLGVASAVAILTVWSRVLGRLHGGRAQVLIAGIVLVGVLPVLLWHGMVAAIVSAIVFGATFMAGPTAVTVLARKALPHHAWTTGIALLTAAFSAGQAIGPLASGILSDQSGGITKGLWLSVILLAAAMLTGLAQREPARHDAQRPALATVAAEVSGR
jgi:predicted MFS family arabinose efflux permease